MSRGQSQPRTQPGRILERCKNKSNVDNLVFIDVDRGKIDVVIVDAPESSNQRSRHFKATRKKGKFSSSGVINIDDENDGDSESPRHADSDASLQKASHLASSDSHQSEEFVGKRQIPSRVSENVTCTSRSGSSRKIFFLNHPYETAENYSFELDTSGSESSDMSDSNSFKSENSESDSSDCEIDDFSGNIRQEWEKAALKRKKDSCQFGLEECQRALGSFTDPRLASHETTQEKVGPSTSSNEKNNLPSGLDTGGFCSEDYSLKSKGKSSGAVGDHTIDQVSNETPCFQENEDFFSEESFQHRAHSRDEATFSFSRSYPITHLFSVSEASFYSNQFQEDKFGKEGDASFIEKVERAHGENSSDAAVRLGKLQKEKPNYGNLSDGADFPPNQCAGLQDKKKQVPFKSFKSACNTELRNDINIVDANATFPHKDESVFGESSIYKGLPQDEAHNIRGDYSHSQEEPVVGKPFLENLNDETPARCVELFTENGDAIPEVSNDLIGEREKHKKSDEYKRAAEEEWASRQRQLQVQAEEAQRLKKRKKAESLRLLEMAKRQKQRLVEMRESQKRDEESINLKEHLRAEVRKELDIMEVKYRDMASLLHGLGIRVGGWPYPMSCEVSAAYKQALLRFHPDRASRTDLRQQVEAEEKFKLISRLKEKLLPVA